MAATYAVNYATGADASPSWVALPGGSNDAFRFKTNTDVAVTLSDPIPIPTSGYNYSFWVSVSLKMTGTYTQIDNIRHYANGAIGWTYGSGGALNINTTPAGLTDAQYEQSQGTVGTSGDELQSNHSVITVVSAIGTSPVVIDAGPYTSSPDQSDHIVMQTKVDTAVNGAVQGVQDPETLTWLVDEI